MKRLEQALHRATAELLAAVLPPSVVWSTIGHGGGGRVRGAMLKGMGLRPGLPDIMIVAPTQCRVLFLELKAPKGRVSPEQREMADKLTNLGCGWVVCRSLDNVLTALDWWQIPQRVHRERAS